ncbi:YidB family protein [Piscinibacter sp. XHJ-5]|uniref:YidB family protein n=1 Tax=Piscinibacter sp. XHJ-5 TaxID=3037797 RepID=UPI0024529141|nr:YidB family protein [Piscinibacter sp. XHJ-5]
MGLLDQILGGLAATRSGRSFPGQSGGGMGNVVMALLPVVLGMLANRQGGTGMGGLGGLLEQLTRGGYGQQASSWVGTGPNEALPAQAWSDVFGPEQLAAIASQAGVSEDEARAGLSELMPEMVDRLTPEGQMPPQDQLLASIDEYERRLQG